ncbi:uncharacterized protein LOC8064853 isoform X1 [Sorghum bicolor]|uniref:uncharacterized protein LOC8064853 isoform X1 n=1 Tax=Sorghum bicolor TaxID=4558 RepID=UPI000B426700|nr:uncharacterized protein LOC8064853 isoform X1 [Sorghum bicolor]XP_021307950.1 uncharacterized protein LOC8064853 isoform X1 [Sorghum bicolor]|eukprot:XP_021307949.1 uncharacterized protein LOC8064853 isoform X1 [Sorghum bicolor]
MSLAWGAVSDAAHAARERDRHKEEPEGGKKKQRQEVVFEDQALVVVLEVTVETQVPQGWLSFDAVVSIEQFASEVHWEITRGSPIRSCRAGIHRGPLLRGATHRSSNKDM